MMHTQKKRGFRLSLAAIAAFTLGLVLVLSACSANNGAGDVQNSASADSASAEEGKDLVIPVSEISETAKFYSVTVDGTPMEVIAVKAPDGTIRTAFNTCQVCYGSGKGYYQQSGNQLVCQNCGNEFGMDRVEVEAGGCNPWPIFAENKTVTDESITITYDFLKESKDIFANWKASH